MCECSSLSRWLFGDSRTTLFLEMETIEADETVDPTGDGSESTRLLKRCLDCQQLWQVDEWKRETVGLGIKVDDERSWKLTPDHELRRPVLIHNHGGLSERECEWQDCGAQALNDSPFCPDCACVRAGLRA